MMKAAGDLSHTPGPDWPCYSNEARWAPARRTSSSASRDPRRWSALSTTEASGPWDTGAGSSIRAASLRLRLDRRHQRALRDRRAATPVAPANAGGVAALRLRPVAMGLQGLVDRPRRRPRLGAVRTDNAQVQVAMDGDPLTVSAVQTLDDGYGTGRTLSWNVAVPASADTADHDLQVTIDGVTLQRRGVPDLLHRPGVHRSPTRPSATPRRRSWTRPRPS